MEHALEFKRNSVRSNKLRIRVPLVKHLHQSSGQDSSARRNVTFFVDEIDQHLVGLRLLRSKCAPALAGVPSPRPSRTAVSTYTPRTSSRNSSYLTPDYKNANQRPQNAPKRIKQMIARILKHAFDSSNIRNSEAIAYESQDKSNFVPFLVRKPIRHPRHVVRHDSRTRRLPAVASARATND